MTYGEIMYLNDKNESVHSDFDSLRDRKFLHDLLDEWLDKGNNTGLFYLGDVTWTGNESAIAKLQATIEETQRTMEKYDAARQAKGGYTQVLAMAEQIAGLKYAIKLLKD